MTHWPHDVMRDATARRACAETHVTLLAGSHVLTVEQMSRVVCEVSESTFEGNANGQYSCTSANARVGGGPRASVRTLQHVSSNIGTFYLGTQCPPFLLLFLLGF